jgi:hypothetical protein
MISTQSNRPTAAERYAVSISSSDLGVNAGHCDADKLIAAGWVASDPKRAAALALYRMSVAGNTQGLETVIDTMDGWLNGRMQRRGGRPMPKHQRREAVASVLRWWIRPTCAYCEGRCFELTPRDEATESGAGVLSGKACFACHGTGRRPVAREVPDHMGTLARDLADELDRLVILVTGEMARRLNTAINLEL